MTRAIPWTPQQIMDHFQQDVFELAFDGLTDTNPPVIATLKELCWERYRNQPVGEYDKDYWIICLADKVSGAYRRFARLAPAWIPSALMDAATAKETASTGISQAGSVHNENEKLPNGPVTSTKYLDTRSDATTTQDTDTTATSSRQDGLNVEILRRQAEALKAIDDMFVNELADLFLNRW